MNSVLQAVLGPSQSPTFRITLVLILVAEAITILSVWLLLDSSVKSWINDKSMATLRVAQLSAASRDWSQIGSAPRNKGSRLFASYRRTLDALSNRYYPSGKGGVFLEVVERKEEFLIQQGQNHMDPMADNGPADQWELGAYSTGEPTRTLTPQTDATGTWLEAFTPILRDGKVVGLIGAEVDSAPLADFQDVAKQVAKLAFWFSVLPAILLSFLVAYVFATMFVRPTDVLRTIEETAQSRRTRTPEEEKNDPWNQLTPRETEIAELLGQGREHIKDLARSLSVGEETIKQHLKNIKQKTGWSKQGLAMQAAGRRAALTPATV